MEKVAKWIKSWEWPQEINENVELLLEEGETLHVCCGTSEIGDVFVDLDPKRPDIVPADMRNLPFLTNEFDNVILDPPWKLGYYQRFRPFYEAVRVCKIGGLIIYNATWIPYAKNTELVDVYVRRDSHWGNISVFSVFRKISEDPVRRDIIHAHD